MSEKIDKFLRAVRTESKLLDMFKPNVVIPWDVQYAKLPRVIEEPWPLNVCRYIKTCLDRGGYAVSFYPFKMNSETFAQCRCLQREKAEWKHGNVPSAVISIPKHYYTYMRSRIGEWREIWQNICKEGKILKEGT